MIAVIRKFLDMFGVDRKPMASAQSSCLAEACETPRLVLFAEVSARAYSLPGSALLQEFRQDWDVVLAGVFHSQRVQLCSKLFLLHSGHRSCHGCEGVGGGKEFEHLELTNKLWPQCLRSSLVHATLSQGAYNPSHEH